MKEQARSPECKKCDKNKRPIEVCIKDECVHASRPIRCRYEGCTSTEVYCRGLCKKHYSRDMYHRHTARHQNPSTMKEEEIQKAIKEGRVAFKGKQIIGVKPGPILKPDKKKPEQTPVCLALVDALRAVIVALKDLPADAQSNVLETAKGLLKYS